MKKIIRNLLMGFVSFFPIEKAVADQNQSEMVNEASNTVVKALDTVEQDKILFDHLKKKDTVSKELENLWDKVKDEEFFPISHAVAIDQVNETLDLLEKMEEEPLPKQSEEIVLTNLFDNVQNDYDGLDLPEAAEPLLEDEVTQSELTNQSEVVQTIASHTNEISVAEASISPEILVTSSETNVAPVSVVLGGITNEVISVQEPEESLDVKAISGVNSTDTVTNEFVSIQEPKESTETNDVPTDIVINTKPSLISEDHRTKTPLNFTENISEKHEIPATDNMGKFFDWLLIGLSAAGISGILGKLVYTYSKFQRRNKKIRMTADYEELAYSPSFSQGKAKEKPIEQKKEPIAPIPPRKKIVSPSKQKDKIETPIIELDENSHQKGVKMLANIKLRRADINRQMKVLRQEIVKFHQSTPEWVDIANQMSELTQERKKLALEARQARILIKGKQGELIKEERRLLAKEMRLAKKTNDTERIDKIMRKRLAIKQQEKQILSEALKEVKKRQEEASKWQGIRLFQEVHSEEKALKERIKQLKKETGLKQKEILELEENLNDQHKQIKAKKSLARKKVKGSFFTAKRRILSRQIIMAHNNNNVEGENLLKQELQDLKQTEKEHIKQVENSDYLAERRKKIKEIHPIVDKHVKVREAEEQKRQAQKQHQAERDDRALFLRGQRMLRDLREGLSEAVNLNQMTPQDYKKWAYGKIGKNWIDGFDYEKDRASFLKPNVLAHIYLVKKERGLVK